MMSDGERSDEDSRLDDATTNGDAKGDNPSSAKVNGNPDDGDESSVASTFKDAKPESKERDSIGGKSKTKKKKKGAAYSRLRDFRKSKGYDIFAKMSPANEEIAEEEVVTHVIGKKPLLGKVWRDTNSGDLVRYRCFSYAIEYQIGDHVFIESQRPEQPFYICCIQDFKMSKRDTLNVHIKWFYRTNEVPEQVYQLLIQDRHTEHKTFHKALLLAEKAANEAANNVNGENKKAKRPRLDDRMLRMRELFVSEATDVYPVSVLRGKCNVYHCQDIKAVKEFEPNENTFFFTLSYNPETRRLASTQGEIRVGASHQAILPDYSPDIPIDERSDPEEEMTWEPGRIHDHDLLMYLRAGRSMAAFAAMCDGESPEEGFVVASRDGIAANAIQHLHEASYDTGKALQALLKTPFPVDGGADPSRKWPEEDVKEFIKGLRMYGKNFFKIRQEFLPHRETPELVEFYYLWKKTPGAANNRPRGRRPRPGVIRRVKTSGKTSSGKGHRNEDDPDDLSSCSEEPDDANENENAENGDLSPYYCRHCFTTSSRDWHHAGKDKVLVCLECRLYFKKYGELPCLEPSNAGDEEDESTTEEEEEEIKPPTDKKLDINAIEQDSSAEVDATNYNNVNGTSNSTEPVEIKGELPKSIGLVSPVPTMPTHVPAHQPQAPSLHPGMHSLAQVGAPGSQVIPPANVLPGPPPAHSNNDVQVLPKPQSQPPPVAVQQQPPPPPQPPREDSPPPKPDGTECHRSQSAIFTRQWNRGEGNSCSRTDLYFKPVPDSKLARKREERMRKAANEREEAMKVVQAQEQAAKVARLEMNHFDPFARQTPSNVPPPSLGLPPGLGSPYAASLSDLERFDREQRAMNAAAMAGAPRSPYPNPPGTPGPPPGSAAAAAAMAHLSSMEGRRIEELMARATAEARANAHYAALASTDPLLRLRLAGVNPEIPTGAPLHPAYAGMMAGGPRPPPGFDPRFRSPADLMSQLGPGFSARPALPEFFQRQQLERELSHSMSLRQQHALMAQQDEYLRGLQQEANARNSQISVSRP